MDRFRGHEEDGERLRVLLSHCLKPAADYDAAQRMAKGNTPKANNSALGFEATLWATADKLRANLPFNMSDWGGENLRQELCL